MRLQRLGDPGHEIPVAVDDHGTWDLRGLTDDIDGAFLADDGIRRVREALQAESLPALEDPADGSALRVGAPIARPSAVICIGMNYAAHARESGAEPPTDIVVFHKHPNTVVGPFDDILLPPGSTTTDWEVELGVVIGRRARYLPSREAALECIAGFVLTDDVSEREHQIQRSGGQWSKGKSFETFNPVGPWFVPRDELGDGSGLRLTSRVNGETRQNSNTDDLIFDVAEIVHRLSRFTVLEPGDLINTGTPEGVGLSGRFPYLAAGDVVEVEIAGLGSQRSTVRAAEVAS
ncbi:2-keto-4-pentenoate hydratase/2-oxohepta-3-ene-1,7-dioic acid hydratase in catechol pathway [Diaminobutyricimonas aerilata]|uniref:2-keto-4-pentenoate hydratase/2-oxohepta-3-ene-1,7-dioic acid hydratase in catechol pathway n=1 Tax=Diaminobutyricimonas aerilata TaxID=1162967 RepID=A0A2M9CNA2_9MICO|nr:fumarylacetoacetate hydrolase family protein [Diaminobutyricimonas aerilata]PJJ73334.1 2-keto-4-pentenoate hydratase/2-oxohepta-3-ene-1,7-dioic acid hydratase in catechol pathway [Diaminobutyricimonas aerilata]